MEAKEKKTATRDKKPGLTVAVIGVAVVMLAVLLIVFASLAPSLTAKSKFGAELEAVKKNESFALVNISDPKADAGMGLTGYREVVVRDASEIAKLRETFIRSADSLSYSATEGDNSPDGYDYRLRFRSGDERYDFYIDGGRFYIVEDSVRYYMTPEGDSAEALAELTGLLKKCFEAQE